MLEKEMVEAVRTLNDRIETVQGQVTEIDRNMASNVVVASGKDADRVRSVYEKQPGARKQANGDMISDDAKTALMGFRMMRGEGAAKKNGITPVEQAQRWQDEELIASYQRKDELVEQTKSSDEHVRKFAEDTLGGGIRCEAFEKLYPVSVSSQYSSPNYGNNCLEQLGVGTIPFNGREMKYTLMERLTGGGFVANCKGAPASVLDVDAIKLKQRKQTLSVCLCNENLDASGIAWDAVIADQSELQINSQKNYWYFRGRGLSDAPLGMNYWAEFAGNKIEMATIAPGDTMLQKYEAVVTEVAKLKRKVRCEGKAKQMAVALNCRTVTWLETIIVDGRKPFAEEMQRGFFEGMPFCSTTELPTNLAEVSGSTGNETEIYVFDPTAIKTAVGSSFEFEVHPGATFEDANGITRFGAQEGLTLFVGNAFSDHLDTKLGATTALGYGVTWGDV